MKKLSILSGNKHVIKLFHTFDNKLNYLYYSLKVLLSLGSYTVHVAVQGKWTSLKHSSPFITPHHMPPQKKNPHSLTAKEFGTHPSHTAITVRSVKGCTELNCTHYVWDHWSRPYRINGGYLFIYLFEIHSIDPNQTRPQERVRRAGKREYATCFKALLQCLSTPCVAFRTNCCYKHTCIFIHLYIWPGVIDEILTTLTWATV